MNSILQYGHVEQNDYFVVFTASVFPCVLVYPNLMKVETESTVYLTKELEQLKRSVTKSCCWSGNAKSGSKCCDH